MASRARSRISPSAPARIADPLPQRVEVDAVTSAEALLAQAALDRLALDGAKEEALEQHVEYAAVLLRFGQRGGQRLTEVLTRSPAHGIEGAECVEQL
jgi:hypothetical protein